MLNARHHEREAAIVAQAGKPGAITIATNMAGRGTDIQLGGNAEMRIAEELADMPAGPEREAREAAIRADVAAAEGEGDRRGRPLRARHRAPRERAASTTSSAAAPAARAIPAARNSSCRCRTT
ncbi:MAG: hypothetical protein NVV72_11320 [Asticcacaulis sp.]|nr:hypothetical protein [Asticcacaulis sp.]